MTDLKMCDHCGKEYHRHKIKPSHWAQRKFCSVKCSGARQSTIEKFMPKIIPDPNSGCWLWDGYVNRGGYGRFGEGYAHRYSYEKLVGVIPPGLFVLHKCDVPSCVNPNHLWLGTQADNLADMRNKGRDDPGGLMRRTKNA